MTTPEEINADLLEACMSLVLGNMHEDDTYSNDHLRYQCLECSQEALDEYTAIPHEADCDTGKAQAVISRARGEL